VLPLALSAPYGAYSAKCRKAVKKLPSGIKHEGEKL
jgi:hypothetical protein